jgi:DNA adenine methylase
MLQLKHRAFLKWAGGKYSLVDEINKHFPKKTKTLVEPFVGAGSVFLNSNFDHYILNDINEDLINLYKQLQDDVELFIESARGYFSSEYNEESSFYELRERFNKSEDIFERSVLFLYLNRHCYNGLCRYNQSGKYNVPFGRYKKPYFPEKEIRTFAEKAQKATFTSLPFQDAMLSATSDSAIYCDPPYVPVSETAYFTSYAKQGFGLEQQKELAELAKQINTEHGTFVMISNHDTKLTQEVYRGAKKVKLSVSRSISQKGDSRKKVSELLAIYKNRRLCSH